jgi:hypothetical protein
MRALVLIALRVVLVAAFAGSIFVQVVMVPLIVNDIDDAGEIAHLRVPFAVIAVLWVLTTQVVMVCIWMLVRMVSRNTVFSRRAFRYVDIVIGAVAAASVITFSFAVVLAPGEAVAPGIVLLVCGAALVIGGVALVVWVMRMLLAQAVERDAQARQLQDELDEVI